MLPGADAHSGVYSYTFQKSTTSATAGFDAGVEKTSTSGTYDYTYTGLTPATRYYLRVIVKDKVGKTTTSNVGQVTTHCKTARCSGGSSATCTNCSRKWYGLWIT